MNNSSASNSGATKASDDQLSQEQRLARDRAVLEKTQSHFGFVAVFGVYSFREKFNFVLPDANTASNIPAQMTAGFSAGFELESRGSHLNWGADFLFIGGQASSATKDLDQPFKQGTNPDVTQYTGSSGVCLAVAMKPHLLINLGSWAVGPNAHLLARYAGFQDPHGIISVNPVQIYIAAGLQLLKHFKGFRLAADVGAIQFKYPTYSAQVQFEL
jgi:hypothetical protein